MLSWKSNHREGVSEQAWPRPIFIHKNRCSGPELAADIANPSAGPNLRPGSWKVLPIQDCLFPSPSTSARIRPLLRPVLLFEGEEKYYFGNSTNRRSSLCSAWSLGHKGWESTIASVQRSPTHCLVGSVLTDVAQAAVVYSPHLLSSVLLSWWLLVKTYEPDSRVQVPALPVLKMIPVILVSSSTEWE